MRQFRNSGNNGCVVLQVLVYLRYLVIATQVVTVLVVSQWLGLDIPVTALLAVSAGLLAFNLATHVWWHRHRNQATGTGLLVCQLLVDLAALTTLLYLTGGPGNPFVSLYLVPVALAAIALEVWPMLALTLTAAALYTWLLKYHLPLPGLHSHDFQQHVLGMWVNFLLTAVIMVVTLSRTMAMVKEQRRQLFIARERALRDESLLAIGSLAAGTAHELNTPLATMGLLIEDWASATDAPSAADFQMMREQLGHCRNHVRTLVEIARQRETDEPVDVMADQFVRDCVERWRLLRPSVAVEVTTHAGDQRLRVDATLPQAMINLFNNAAEANAVTGAAGAVEIATEVRGLNLRIRICDRGPGPQAIPARAELPGDSGGLGIGLMISNASIERSCGGVRQYPRAGGGCVTEVELPLVVGAA